MSIDAFPLVLRRASGCRVAIIALAVVLLVAGLPAHGQDKLEITSDRSVVKVR